MVEILANFHSGTFPSAYVWIDDVLYCQCSCSNIGTRYLYWHGYCISSCLSQFMTRWGNDYLVCDFQRDDITACLYWNGTGASACSSPLTTHIGGTPLLRKMGEYKCLLPQYLDWEGACESSCPFPSEGERNSYRYPFKAIEDWYWNRVFFGHLSFAIPCTPYGSNFLVVPHNPSIGIILVCHSPHHLWQASQTISYCMHPSHIGTVLVLLMAISHLAP